MAWASRRAENASRRLRWCAAGVFTLTLVAADVGAQRPVYMDTGNPNVVVDLSVIEDGGYGTPSMAVPPRFGRQRLMMPGTRAPMSQLHVPPGSKLANVSLPQPSPGKAASQGAIPVAPKPAPAKAKKRQAPAPKPAKAAQKPEPEVAKAEAPAAPAPEKAPRSEVAASKAPPPAAKTAASAIAETAGAPPPPPAPPTVDKESTRDKVPPAAAAAKKKAPQQVAALPAGDVVKPGQTLKVVFPEAASKMPAEAKGPLRNLAAAMKGKAKLRLQLHAYAGGESLSASKARRLSLSRALSVRSYLIETGVRSTRIDVRALGNKATDEPLNRVDVVVVER